MNKWNCRDIKYKNTVYLAVLCGCSSMVECHLAMVDVAGSSPVSRSIVLRKGWYNANKGYFMQRF